MNAPNYYDPQRQVQGWYPYSARRAGFAFTEEATFYSYPTSLAGMAATPGGWAARHAGSRLRAISGSVDCEAKGSSTNDVRLSFGYSACEKYHQRERLVSDQFPAILAMGEDVIGTAEYDYFGETYNYQILSEATNEFVTSPFLSGGYTPHAFSMSLIFRRIGDLGPTSLPLDFAFLTVAFRAGIFVLRSVGSDSYEPSGTLNCTMFQPGRAERLFPCAAIDSMP